ncbi:MAG: hypothetical protein M1814_005229 [Vezdaea aestivalis]|nr:MAG: hypothetical protein M1814_005229 [Vezdaea aestivalis]
MSNSANPLIPVVPPRPARTQKAEGASAAAMDIPRVPPRPNRHVERAITPDRDSFARSPLNETTFAINTVAIPTPQPLTSELGTSLPQRPSSVTLPSIGQEGNEYANLEDAGEESDTFVHPGASATQLRNVDGDLKLYAPKPSLPTSSAKARVATVTRTDSSQAAAAGFGKLPLDDTDPQSRSLKAKSSFVSQRSTTSVDRPTSAHLAEGEGQASDFGQRVPMYPNAGVVQAPSPAPTSSNFGHDVGYTSESSLRPGRNHGRKKSGRETFQPPGSYGLHGHGVTSQDRFERAWYEKHPEVLEREQGEYGPGVGAGRTEWAMSSDDLNKIVRDTASRGAGFGTSSGVLGTPSEQIGYIASEEYTARLTSASTSTATSPRPPSSSYMTKGLQGISSTHGDSPLRKTQFGSEAITSDSLRMTPKAASSTGASESEGEDGVHIEPPARRVDKYGGKGYDPPTQDLGPRGGNTSEEGGWVDEHGYGVPILASDQVAKEPAAGFMQPAVEPPRERRGSSFMIGQDEIPGGSRGSSLAGSLPASRPTSRPASVHGLAPSMSRFSSHDEHDDRHTPLEDVEEYEPLFPDEEAKARGEPLKPTTATHRLRHADLAKHGFPSKDIWEDAPNSAQLMTTVDTPEPEEDARTVTAEDEPELKASDLDDEEEEDSESFLEQEKKERAKLQFKSHLRDEMRPSLAQRFPSRDIWEDTPASLQLETVVGEPQSEESKAITSPERPTTSIVARTALAAAGGLAAGEDRATTSIGSTLDKSSLPTVPARPTKKLSGDSYGQDKSIDTSDPSTTSERKLPHPSIPDRPKPQVPARPARPGARDSSEQVPLSKTISSASARSIGSQEEGVPLPKSKPAVPSKPNGSKIASLKAGFMSDLDKRLQLGPQAPKPADRAAEDSAGKEEEAAPLSDSRKGRARGPPRRKPAASPSGAEEGRAEAVKPAKLELAEAATVWQVAEDGELLVNGTEEMKDKGRGEEGSSATSSSLAISQKVNEPSGIAKGLSAAKAVELEKGSVKHKEQGVDDGVETKEAIEESPAGAYVDKEGSRGAGGREEQ